MKKIIITILWIVSVCTAFYFGSRIGARENWLADAQYRAAVASGQLRLLDEDRSETLREVLNIELDSDLVAYGAYLDSRWKWLWSELQPETSRAVTSAAKYRASHPFSPPDLGDPKNNKSDASFRSKLASEQEENQLTVARIVAMYAH
jgi:hypothetical protein